MLAGLILLVGARVAVADRPLYRWVDEAGNLSLTDRLEEVPEPYFSMYVAKQREAAARAGAPAPSRAEAASAAAAAPGSTATTGASAGGSGTSGAGMPSIIAQEAELRRYWRELVAKWRAELEAATQAVAAAEEEVGTLTLNPLLRETPEIKAKLGPAEERRRAAQARVETARRMLLKDLPARAKKELVPPAWLL